MRVEDREKDILLVDEARNKSLHVSELDADDEFWLAVTDSGSSENINLWVDKDAALALANFIINQVKEKG